MNEIVLAVPVDVFSGELLPFLAFKDVVNLDSANLNKKCRVAFKQRLNGETFPGNRKQAKKLNSNFLKWLNDRLLSIKSVCLVEDCQKPSLLSSLKI